MKKSRLVGLVGAGQLSRSCLTQIPGLPEQLGPVIAPSYRLASRLVNSLRAGYPVQGYKQLEGCRTVLISVPESQLEKVVGGMAGAELDWRRRVVLLCDSKYDSTELAALAARGAATGSLSPIRGFDHRFIVEGHREAVREARRLVHNHRARTFEIQPARKALYQAGLCFATCLFLPLVDAATQCLRAAGLNPAASWAVAEQLFHKTLRAYLHAGRKAWTGSLASEDRQMICWELEALEAADPLLACYFRVGAALALELFERDSDWLPPALPDRTPAVASLRAGTAWRGTRRPAPPPGPGKEIIR